MCGKEGQKLQKYQYHENKNIFFDEIKKIFYSFFEGLSYGEKIKIWLKRADTSFKDSLDFLF